jgi:hypothetical protein
MGTRGWVSRSRAALAAIATVALLGTLLIAGLSSTAGAAPGHSVELRVLVVAVGSPGEDAARRYIEGAMDAIGVAYTTLDASRADLTDAFLRTGGLGHFNGVILTDAELRNAAAAHTFTEAEWALLHEYERDFSVRESVLKGFPATVANRTDYGMANAIDGTSFVGHWTPAAGAVFAGVDTTADLDVDIFGYGAIPRNDLAVPVTPLLVADDTGRALVARVDYADGRQVLLSTLNQLDVLRHSQVLSYAFIDFATSGVHLGARRIHLSAHVDDLFLSSPVWDPTANADSTDRFRITPAALTYTQQAQADLAGGFGTLSDFHVEMAFNGVGVNSTDPLTVAAVADADEFTWLNHTFTHRNFDTENGAGHAAVVGEINNNLNVWRQRGFPGLPAAAASLVTGEHSGLANGAITYPAGLNPGLASAMVQTGVEYIASDVSRANQAREQYIPGTSVVMLPRYPAGVYFNAGTPELMADEYDYLNRERYIENGGNPCTIPGAVCTQRTYPEIVAAEATVAVTHMLSGRAWSHYFHQANLQDYDTAGDGASLLFDWLGATIALYEQHMTLPIENLTMTEIGDRARARLEAAAADVSAVLTINTGEVAISSSSSVPLEVTGLAGGTPYGPKLIRSLTSGPVRQVMLVDGYVPPSGHPPPPPPTPTTVPIPSPTPIPEVLGEQATPTPIPVVLCGGVAVTIFGTEGDDILAGGAGSDVIAGFGGNDIITGGAGDDIICAGPGADIVNAGRGNDRVFGNGGRDNIRGNGGRDDLRGGGANDIIRGGPGIDAVRGGRGNDTLRGNGGSDTVRGDGGRDKVFGNGGSDVLKGGGGVDRLNGGRGIDRCDGGRGTDTASACEITAKVP